MTNRRLLSLMALVLFMGLISFVNSAWAGKSPAGDEAAKEQAALNAVAAQRMHNSSNGNSH
jgi:hypothetical protein